MIFSDRPKFMYHLLSFGISNLYCNLMEIIQAEPRPYMIDDNIASVNCSTEFGDPSGHGALCF